MLFKKAIATICLLVLISTPAVSLQVLTDETGNKKEQNTLTITEDNFDCFQSLQCLKRENPFKKSNLDEIRLRGLESERYTVEGTSKNETMYALYNGSGKLIKANVVQRNIVLPRAIFETLSESEYTSWTVIGNELIIRDFDENRMQYKVILQNGGEVKIEHFDKNGRLNTPSVAS